MDLVREGKLTPEDAAEIIDAFMASEKTEASGDGPPPPPPPFDEPPKANESKDPFRSFMDFVEGFGKEVTQSVNWQDVAKHMKTAAEKGMEGIKSGVEQIKQGKVNFGWFSATEVKEITLPIDPGSGKTIRIENPSGSVKISGGFETSSVSAKAQVRGATIDDAQAKAENYTIIVEESEHYIDIRQPDVSGLSVDLVIQLSVPCPVEARTQHGDVRISDTGAGCRLNTQSGDTFLRGLNGPIEVVAQNGDVSVESCSSPSMAIESKHGDVSLVSVSGNVNARTAGGDIRGRSCSGKTWSVESVSGDVSMEFSDAVSGVLNIRTVNGDTELFVPDGCSCRVSLSTLRGTVSSGIPLDESATMEQRITGRLGDGAGTIDVSAVNGNIAFKWRDAVAV